MLFICYSKCSTCKKAKKYLDDNKIEYEERDIKSNNPTRAELDIWVNKYGYPVNKMFNTSGLLYKELELSKKLNDMTLDKKYELLASNGMLIKRPILITDNNVLFGFKIDEWKKVLGI